jgi:hypothetical protein
MLPPEADLFDWGIHCGAIHSEDVNNGELWTAVVRGEELVLAAISPEGAIST